MKGKCNCGKKATSEWLIKDNESATCLKFCDSCRPKTNTINIQLLYEKKCKSQ